MKRPSRLQVTYQRNMAAGMFIAIILTVTFAVLIKNLDTDDTISRIDKSIVVSGVDITFTPQPARRSLGRKSQGISPLRFSGFVGGAIKIIPDSKRSIMEPILPKLELFSLDPVLPIGEDDLSFSSIEGDATGIFVPEEYLLNVDHVNNTQKFRTKSPINRNPEVIIMTEPDYPFVAKDADKEGVVRLMLHLDSRGKRTPFSYRILTDGDTSNLEFFVRGDGQDKLQIVLIDENPKDWFFADRVLDVIDSWSFSPAITDGEPVSTFLEITWNFCLGVNCTRLLMSSSPQ